MPPKGTKKQQDAIARKEITKKKQFCDESKLDCPSGSEEAYDIDSSDDSLAVTTRSQARVALVACIMLDYLLNIPRIIAIKIRERAINDNTTILFLSLIF
ncbi:hypothetical protein HAX54_014558 [Datura stramonium]|uniref:Uncharacterized protein n=1 Tax=Datura stramonium TaxID=4076 RepID=A0ABS8Y619_DATST|nr:hypothetical protein [Datura stramonium]